jgi:hypothetical protein
MLAGAAGAATFTLPVFNPDSGQPAVKSPEFAAFGDENASAKLALNDYVYDSSVETYTVTKIYLGASAKGNPYSVVTGKATTTKTAHNNDYYTLSLTGQAVGSLFQPNADYSVTGFTDSLTANLLEKGGKTVLTNGFSEVSKVVTSAGKPTTQHGTIKVNGKSEEDTIVTTTYTVTNSCSSNCSVKLTNTTDIYGTKIKTPYGTVSHETLLYSAPLLNVAVDSKHEGLGFADGPITGWVKNVGLASNLESVWLFALAGKVTDGTTVPTVPADYTKDSQWDAFLAELKYGKITGGSETFTSIGSIASVPLPTTALLMMGGLAGLTGFARRRSVAAPAG